MKGAAIQKIGQIGIPVKNVERALHFYQHQLGLQLLFHTETMAFLECRDVRIMLILPEKEQFSRPSSVIYFQVDNIHHTYEELKVKSISFIDEPHVVAKMDHSETWMTFFEDTEGNVHAFMSETTI
ncbi:VOC family protein [Halobacillus sp. B23F22_1]|uniref:VOC family protein n=1 Tax=Halobacillus sp. B23F22_1 TaxID=3459514 RepID=UPI00373E5463